MKRSKITTLAVKAMGLFGGVQVLGILCSIIRTKLVALWIGPVGVGLFGIFNQALEMLNTATNLGIRSSSVRDISQAAEENNAHSIARIIHVVRRWSLWLGVGGALLTLLLSPLLSYFTFDSYDYFWHYAALAIAVLLIALTNGEYAVLQGLSKLKQLASVTLLGTLGGLAISIPLFYYLRERSILPSIIAYALCCAIAAGFIRNRNNSPKVSLSRHDVAKTGIGFIKLGIYMTAGTFVTMLAGYAFTAWLNYKSGTGEVGFYQAGYTLITKYTGLVFTALGMEFYPRLSRIASSKIRLRAFVSQEINVSLLVLAPILALFIVLCDPIISLLYTGKFTIISTMVAWGLAGTLLRAVSWCMAFVILARGDGRVFLVTESLSAAFGLALNIVFYQYWGLAGLGVSYLVWYLIYTIIIAVVYYHHYKLSLGKSCFAVLAWCLLIVISIIVAKLTGQLVLSVALTIIAFVPTVIAAKKLIK